MIGEENVSASDVSRAISQRLQLHFVVSCWLNGEMIQWPPGNFKHTLHLTVKRLSATHTLPTR